MAEHDVPDDHAVVFGDQGEIWDVALGGAYPLDELCFVRPAEGRLDDFSDAFVVVGALGPDLDRYSPLSRDSCSARRRCAVSLPVRSWKSPSRHWSAAFSPFSPTMR